jgi:hypothetical protein
MTMPGGAEYLPPVVTRFLADISDFLTKAAEAKAAMAGFTSASDDMSEKVKASTHRSGKDIDEFTELIVRDMRKGESATDVLRRRLKSTGDEVTSLRKRLHSEGANQGLFADFRKASDELKRLKNIAEDIAPDLMVAGQKSGGGFLTGLMSVVSKFGEMLIPILVVAIVMATPLIAGAIGMAVSAGLGIGVAAFAVLMAATINKKIKNQFTVMGKELKNALAFALSPTLLSNLMTALQIFRTYIREKLGFELKHLFDSVAPHLPKLFDALAKTLSALLGGLTSAMDAAGPAFDAFLEQLPGLATAVGEFLVEVTKNGPALIAFTKDFFAFIEKVIRGLGSTIAWLEKVYLWLNTNLPKIDKFFTDLPGKIGGFFVSMWNKILDAGKAVGTWFADLGKGIWGWLTGAGDAVGGWADGVVAWFAALPGRIWSAIVSLPGRILNLIKAMAHEGAYLVGYMAGRIVKFFIDLPGRVARAAVMLWQLVSTAFSTGVSWVVTEASKLPGQVAHAFSVMWTAVVRWASATWAAAVSWFGRTKTAIILAISNAVVAAINWFKALPGRAVTALKTFKDKVVAFFKGAKDWLVDAGKDIVRGIVAGVSGMWDWAVNKIKSFAHDVLKGFKDALGISSPSRAFAEAGANSATGYAEGWRRAIGKTRDTFTGQSTMDVIMNYPTAGNPRPPGYSPPPPPGGGGGAMVHTTLNVDGKRFITAITPASQRRGARSGVTGTGIPTARIM